MEPRLHVWIFKIVIYASGFLIQDSWPLSSQNSTSHASFQSSWSNWSSSEETSFIQGSSSVISHNSTGEFLSGLITSQNVSSAEETFLTGSSAGSMGNTSSWSESSRRTEVIFSPQNTLIVVSEDQLPTDYWVPIKPKLRYWPSKTIAANMDSSLTNVEQQIIWDALEALSGAVRTCIKFVQKGPYQRDYLHFRKGKT